MNTLDEFARLYCQEFLKNKEFHLATADSSSLLNILARASCFPEELRQKAGKVRDEVRNFWAHHDYTVWTEAEYRKTLETVMDLVNSIPTNHEAADKIRRL